jgi:hypothetical protein
MTTPQFDNIVISKNNWNRIIAEHEITQVSETPLAFVGTKVITSKWMPDNIMILRLGETIVAVVRFKELPTVTVLEDGRVLVEWPKELQS